MNLLDVKLCRMIGRIDRDFRLRAADTVKEKVCDDKEDCGLYKCGKLCDVARHDAEMLRRGYWWEFSRWN
jgi:hypothetical protein